MRCRVLSSPVAAFATCQKCSELEDRFSDLTEQVASAADRLDALGQTHATQFATALADFAKIQDREFAGARAVIREARWLCNQARAELQEHRAEHGL